MITVREANDRDVRAIREIFLASYGTDYSPRFYDESYLKSSVHCDGNLLLVAEDTETAEVVGTASVDFEVGTCSDLVGQFGRLAVHPAFRQGGIGKLLMSERIRLVQDRISVGLVEPRLAHPYSLKIAEHHQFVVVGFLPMKLHVRQRESFVLLARHFGNTLELRKNYPRIIPEVYPLASLALENCSLTPNAIIDAHAPPYPPGRTFETQDLTAEGYPALLRIERRRLHSCEIFGPVRLHCGISKLHAKRASYLIAREKGRIAGVVGFTVDSHHKAVRILELLWLDDEVIRFLLSDLERAWTKKLAGPADVVEVDVSAHAPRIQRTFTELGFVPVAYVPALASNGLERLDVVKMFRLPAAPNVSTEGLTAQSKKLADLVLWRLQKPKRPP